MANSDVVRRMLQIIDDHEAGRVTSSDVEREIENHMQALEKIGLDEIRESRDLTHRLVYSWFTDGDVDFGDEEDAAAIRNEMRNFFRSLPDAKVAEQTHAPEPATGPDSSGESSPPAR